MPDTPSPVAHWPLAKDARDAVGDRHGHAEALTFTAGPDGSAAGAAEFDGSRSAVRIDHHPSLRLGTGDFTFTAWIRCEKAMTHVFGDVLSKFDPVGRTGVNLHVSGSSPAYSSMSDQRHVHFGIDDGYIGAWEDLGKPEATNSNVTSLITLQGELYAGIADAIDPRRACRVLRYAGGQTWEDCGRLCDDLGVLSVMSMHVHEGKMYAGSGNWDWARAEGAMPGFTPTHVHVYEYQGDAEWRDLGQVGEGYRLMSMCSFEGELYAGLDKRGGGGVYRYTGDGWADCGAPDGRNIEGFLPSGGRLYAATHGRVYRYEGGTSWTCICKDPFGINQIHCIAEVEGRLWIGTWPQGYVLRQGGDGEWINTGRLGIPEGLHECNEVMDLRVHNGKLYAALIPKSQLWRYEADGQWTLMGSLASRPDWHDDDGDSWCRITSLGSHRGRLIAATGSCYSRAAHQDAEDTLGRVHAMNVGQVASHEHDIGGDWTHLAAVRAGKQTRLYVNGKLAASADAPPRTTLDLTNVSPLRIGAGPSTYFKGAIADVRLYSAAIDEKTIHTLSRHG